MKILIIAPPVFSPTVMPYSLAMMKGELSAALTDEIKALDLNALYHYNRFNQFYSRIRTESFFPLLTKFTGKAREMYPQISLAVRNGKKPRGYDKILQTVLDEKPDLVGMSLTYNSQVFFAKSLIQDLQEQGIKVVLGGPADYSKVMGEALALGSAKQFIDYAIENGATSRNSKIVAYPDFSDMKKEHYFTLDPIYPLRTAQSCPYQRCTFCTHHGFRKYEFIDLTIVENAIVKNNIKKVCFIDDDIPLPRLKEIAAICEKHGVQWWCQLRPLKHLLGSLQELHNGGLRSVAWGVESGCQRVLDAMQKGTKIEDVEAVLKEAHTVGIKNMTYVMFGLPTETKDEFMQTIEFLEKNSENIDIVSPSVFGLQQGSLAFSHPDQFGIEDITLKPRTFLGDTISYTPSSGLTQQEATKLKKQNQKRIYAINKAPRIIASCKEQILNWI